MKICVLASGSKGNCTYIESNGTRLLVDIGTTSLYAEKKLKEIEADPKQVNGILVTHTHTDHISGIRVFVKKYKTKLYLTRKIYQELSKELPISNFEIIDLEFKIGEINIEVFKTSHDTPDGNAYIFSHNDSSIVYITDTGYIHLKHHNKLKNKSLYVMESNHDVEMLMNGSYPYHLKQRILGDEGHLSNIDCSNYLSKFIGDKTRDIILIHLSEDNNSKEKALETLNQTFSKKNQFVNHVYVSTQHERTDVIDV